MNDIEEGDYVRIVKHQFLGIGKITKIIGNTIYIKMNISLPISFSEDEIEQYKHSKNIIDLIEVGDYVNGHKVIKEEWGEDDNDLFLKLEGDTHDYNLCSENQIKSILTKEKFKEGEYVVE